MADVRAVVEEFERRGEHIPTAWEVAREKRRLPGELTVNEVAAKLGLAYNTVYRLVSDGKAESRRDGSFLFVTAAGVEAIESRKPGRGGRPRVYVRIDSLPGYAVEGKSESGGKP